jgi:hypothetical protein
LFKSQIFLINYYSSFLVLVSFYHTTNFLARFFYVVFLLFFKLANSDPYSSDGICMMFEKKRINCSWLAYCFCLTGIVVPRLSFYTQN